MTEPEPDLSDMPTTDGVPATEAPVVAGAGETFDDLDSSTPLSAAGGPTQPGGRSTEEPDPNGETR
jgi:hypothetical protein